MKFHKNQIVAIPTGTPISFFSGSLLDKNPFKLEKMEYTAIGRYTGRSKTCIHIDVYSNGSDHNWIANVPIKNKNLIKPSDKIIFWDMSVYKNYIIDPLALPADGSRQYKVEYESSYIQKGQTIFESGGWDIWANSRKEAFQELKRLVKESGHVKCKLTASLLFRNQDPFPAWLFKKEVEEAKNNLTNNK